MSSFSARKSCWKRGLLLKRRLPAWSSRPADLLQFVSLQERTKEMLSERSALGVLTKDDAAPHWYRAADTLVEAHRAGGSIIISEVDYKRFIRLRLSKSSDVAAASLLKELDRRFR